MDYLNKQAIDKTIRSYKAALTKISDKIPCFRMGCNDHNSRSICPRVLELSYDSDHRPELATRTYHSIETLFEYGRPKLVDKGHWVYSNAFFRIQLFWDEEFSIYGWKCPMSDEEGKIIGERMLYPWMKERISIMVMDKSWGIGNWNKNYKDIKTLADKCQSGIKRALLSAAKDADKEVARWRQAIRAISSLAS